MNRGWQYGGWRTGSMAFYLLLLYAILIWCCELLDLLCWLTGIPQTTVLSRILAVLLTAFLGVKVVGVPETDGERPDGWFVAGCIVITVYFAVKAIRPDMSFDTQNYHLASQLPGFVDNLHYHVLPGRFQMFGFRLGDRMFYPFRLLLGFRMGTMLNALAMLVIYRQAVVFLDGMRKARSLPKRWFCNASLLAFLVVSRFELIQESGSYMVELLAIPFFLEMAFLLIREPEEERTVQEAFVFCLAGGFFFCLKMTNIVYLAPLILLYLWKIRRSVTPPLFFGCLAAGLLPVSIYLIYNGITTGNPIFPYYNTIFQSPYYYAADFKDGRWGPVSGLEALLWPWYMVIRPEHRLSEIPGRYNLDLAVSYLAVAGLAAAAFFLPRRQRGNLKKELCLAAVCCISMLLWIVTTGHIRYFMAGLLLFGMLAACAYLRLLESGRPVCLAAAAVLLLPFVGRAGYGYHAVWKGQEWAMRNDSREAYRQNLPLVFRDRELYPPELREKADVIFLTWSNCGSLARLMGEDVPVYNRYSILEELAQVEEDYLGQIEDWMRQGKGVYDMFPQGINVLEEYLAWMNQAGWYVNDLFYLDTILKGVQNYTMAGLEMADGRENTWYYGNFENQEGSGSEDLQREPLRLQKTSDRMRMTAFLGDAWYWMWPMPFWMEVIASDGTTQKTVAVAELGRVGYEKTELLLDLSGLEGEIELTFKSQVNGKQAVVINPEFGEEP